MCLLVKMLAVLAMLWLDFSVAQYSLYITEEHLQSYYTDTEYAELVQGEFMLLYILYVYTCTCTGFIRSVTFLRTAWT